MKIMKVMYVNPMYDQLEHWSIGDRFVSDWVRGNVSEMRKMEDGYINIYVMSDGSTPNIPLFDGVMNPLPIGKLAMSISPNDVNRIYYGEE